MCRVKKTFKMCTVLYCVRCKIMYKAHCLVILVWAVLDIHEHFSQRISPFNTTNREDEVNRDAGTQVCDGKRDWLWV